MSKHTPGPWKVTDKGHPLDLHDFEIVDPSGSYIITRVTCYGNAKANSRLIAAAPEMYEMLKDIYESYAETPRRLIGELLTRINPTT